MKQPSPGTTEPAQPLGALSVPLVLIPGDSGAVPDPPALYHRRLVHPGDKEGWEAWLHKQ